MQTTQNFRGALAEYFSEAREHGYQRRAKSATPLLPYTFMMASFGLFAVSLYKASKSTSTNDNGTFSLADFILISFATHKITRIVSHDRIAKPLRAPFTEEEPKETKKETSKGSGLQRALGDLLTCQFCLGPWVAAGLLFGIKVTPQFTRRMASIFAVVAGSDLLHLAYQDLKSK